MMMPANFSAVAENEMTYVVGGSLVDVLAPAMTTANWQNVSGNVIKIVGNSFLAKYTNDILGQLFDGNYVPGDVIGFSVKNLDKAYNKGYNTFGGNWGFAVGALNAGMQILGGLSAIYTLGSGSIGLETKKGDLPTL
ncbi:hypothetical protein [Faecalibacterium sp.]|uniref:hypothetical protein n=1 Tax=Faecalibacterium sp. TaxID=1971605 RepID=UPI0008207824|nr:hypothetical protein [uncultured Faecalibacterium sp.]MDR3888573.1 hypothetical protein [Faecalibacterium sp.]SCI07346.1 Uncharacterised protein [uncultured Faecalibacterium sp.]